MHRPPPPTPHPPLVSDRLRTAALRVLALAALAALLLWTRAEVLRNRVEPPARAPAGASSASTSAADAWYSCTVAIERETGLSYLLDAERYDAGAVRSLGGGAYAVTVEYPDQGRTLGCRVTFRANGDASVQVTQ